MDVRRMNLLGAGSTRKTNRNYGGEEFLKVGRFSEDANPEFSKRRWKQEEEHDSSSMTANGPGPEA